MPAISQLRAWWAHRPPAAGAAVMATGIVSIGLHLTGYEFLSRISLVLACAAWLALAADFVVRLLWDRARWLEEACTPPGLTAVAATTVLGTRLSALGWQQPAEALLALSAVLWPVLLLVVLRHWKRRMPGGVFLVCVATQGLSVLCAALAAAVGPEWLAHTGLVLFWLGIVLYGVAFTHFDVREVVRGAGDQWVAGGALAISALAGAKLIAAHHVNPYLWNEDDSGVLRAATVALLVLAFASYCVLAVAELGWPKLRYDVRRWATVFPMGMTAVASLSAATALGVSWLKGPGQVLLWISVAAWLAVAAGAVHVMITAGTHRPTGSDRPTGPLRSRAPR
ncbi:tellurite resistance/C4-dicarboxylate transporter family protein [Streptomyces sp. NBC_00996]|uniref:tellurite resistance/C4-dicarboxylate transporter family protein n=1 Tax=Streptomyces sp. NBC_00996 TaxID=2903710 RepID=UPI0038652AB8|nr:tellurite resistance/C4-dicarboxylate transporter family protein [Streptomyces sp. NBC_00996]